MAGVEERESLPLPALRLPSGPRSRQRADADRTGEHRGWHCELTRALHTARTEENLNRCVDWLEAHPSVPPWIDLDQIVSPELRAEGTAMVDEMRAFMAGCYDQAARYQLLLERMKDSFDAARQ